MDLPALLSDESLRRHEFPVCADRVFLAHAAVSPLPRRVSDALIAFAQSATIAGPDEYMEGLKDIRATREAAAGLLRASSGEIALLGPTSLGLSLIAAGLDWSPGDEVLYYTEDYPSNVYPWIDLARRGVVPRALKPARPGEITPELVESALTPRTRLVALASAFFLNGFRPDIDAIGRLLRSRGVLFSLDAIQTLGAAPLSVEHVDFLSADAHKWLLGPAAAGIVYVKREHFERLRPMLLGASNVRSPDFLAQPEMVFLDTAARYEPGVLNVGPILGMKAALEMFLEIGIAPIAARVAFLVKRLADGLMALGFEPAGPIEGPNTSGILTVSHPQADADGLFRTLQERRITLSLRRDRAGKSYLRFSPHFYNTEAELEQALAVLRGAL